MNINLSNCMFIRSAASEKDFPRDGLPQVVMAGRSNVGKSSVINTLVNRKSLARTSNTPGKTAHVNLYMVDKKFYLVDLPGYGYASVSHAQRRDWGALMDNYFSFSQEIALGLLIVDARHEPTNDDVQMSRFFRDRGLHYAVVANKMDKLRRINEMDIDAVRLRLECVDDVKVFPFSAKDRHGRSELLSYILSLIDTDII